MTLFISELSSAASNIIVFFAIPFIWWLIFYRKKENFFNFIGLTRPRLKKTAWLIVIFTVIYMIVYHLDILTFFMDDISMQVMEGNEAMQDSAYHGIGFAAILPGLVLNLIANGLCEEALFRGFILKRLKSRIGVWPAIIIQGALFGVMHNLLYLAAGIPVTPFFHIGLLISTALPGILCGVLNEKVFDGQSIIPSVLLHGFNNFIGTIQTAFLL